MAKHNPGFITGSSVSAILTGKGDSLLKGGITFAEQLGAERSGMLDNELARDADFQGNRATEWGNEYEDEAIQAIESELFVTVTDKQRQFVNESKWASCTVDGMTDKGNCVAEVKCPYSPDVHRGYLLKPDLLRAKYEAQVRFNMWLTGASDGVLVSYDPRWKEPANLVLVKFTVDAKWESRLINRIDECNVIADSVANKLKELI